MNRSIRELYESAAELDPSERAELAALLLESLEPVDDSAEEIEAAWAKEIERRVSDCAREPAPHQSMKSAVRFFREASNEIEHERAWYRKRSVRAEAAFLREIDRAIEAVRSNPRLWPVYLAGTHRYVFRRFPFSLVYLIEEEEILIVAIAARVAGVITVGGSTAADTNWTSASLSDVGTNPGAALAVFAPAHNIDVAHHTGDEHYRINDGYCHYTVTDPVNQCYSGTSWSAAITSGIAARLLVSVPGENGYQIRQRIIDSAVTGRLSGLDAGSPNLLLHSYGPSRCRAVLP